MSEIVVDGDWPVVVLERDGSTPKAAVAFLSGIVIASIALVARVDSRQQDT